MRRVTMEDCNAGIILHWRCLHSSPAQHFFFSFAFFVITLGYPLSTQQNGIRRTLENVPSRRLCRVCLSLPCTSQLSDNGSGPLSQSKTLLQRAFITLIPTNPLWTMPPANADSLSSIGGFLGKELTVGRLPSDHSVLPKNSNNCA